MTKLDLRAKTTNYANSITRASGCCLNHLKVNSGFYFLASMVIALGLDPSETMAFDVSAAGKAMTDPVVKFVNDYWAAGVLAVGAGGAMVAPGDLRTKSIGFGVGALMAGLVMGGVKIGLGI